MIAKESSWPRVRISAPAEPLPVATAAQLRQRRASRNTLLDGKRGLSRFVTTITGARAGIRQSWDFGYDNLLPDYNLLP